MYRVRLVVAAGIAAMSATLAGCAGSSFSLPDWLKPKPPGPALQTLQFESDPPGADVRTAQGQTCRTPCSLAVPLTGQSVTVALDGYLPQTIQVDVHQPTERSNVDSTLAPPDFSPNPVQVSLQAVPPPAKPAAHSKSRKTAAATETAAKLNPYPASIVAPEPERTPGSPSALSSAALQGPPADRFAPAPPMQSSAASPLQPPPQTR